MKIKAFIIGSPVSHSLSPKLHGFWLKQMGIKGDYDAVNVPPEYLVKTVKKLPAKYVGGNVTIPHKEKVLMLCDEVHGIAKSVGAVNTLVFKDSKILGYNTDVFGFIENLSSNNVDLGKINKPLVLGAGGAARAVITALRTYIPKFGEDRDRWITVTNRTEYKAEILADEYGARLIQWDDIQRELSSYDLVINTTSLGMKGQEQLQINLDTLPKNAVVNDIVYNPLETDLLKQAREKGLKTVDGLGMLLYQAVQGFEFWFGQKPDVTPELREYIVRCL
jgi:shikimate dehydrogenase